MRKLHRLSPETEAEVDRILRERGIENADSERLKALEEENAKLKHLYANAMLDNAGLIDLLAEKR